jgi:hypothetical protein
VDSAKELVKLYRQKFDLLQPDSAAAAKSSSASGPSQATINALEDLKKVISNHLQVIVCFVHVSALQNVQLSGLLVVLITC